MKNNRLISTLFIIAILFFITGCINRSASPELALSGELGTVSGRIVSPRGDWAEPAFISLEPLYQDMPYALAPSYSSPFSNNIQFAPLSNQAPNALAPASYSCITDANGHYSINNVLPGSYALCAWTGNHQKATQRVTVIARAVTDLGTIQLTPTGSVKGKLTLGAFSYKGYTIFVPGTSFISMAHEDGSFSLSHIPVGSYELAVMVGFTRFPIPTEIEPGETTDLGDIALSGMAILSSDMDIQSGMTGIQYQDFGMKIILWDLGAMQAPVFSETLVSGIEISPNNRQYSAYLFSKGDSYREWGEYVLKFQAKKDNPLNSFDLEPDKKIHITFTDNFADANGVKLASPTEFSFSTQAGLNSFVQAVYANDIDLGIQGEKIPVYDNKKTCLIISFTKPMDKSTVEEAHSLKPSGKNEISPDLFSWESLNTAILYFDDPLDVNTTYTLKLAKSAKSLAGEKMDADFSLNFKTTGISIPKTISTNTTWDLANSPYYLNDTVEITAKLTLEEGVKIVGNNNNLSVKSGGSLISVGRANKPIRLISTNIIFDSSTASQIKYCNFQGSELLFKKMGNSTMENSNFYCDFPLTKYNNLSYAMLESSAWNDKNITVSGNDAGDLNMENCFFDGIGIIIDSDPQAGAGDITIKNCNIHNNTSKTALIVNKAAHLEISNCNIRYNKTGIAFKVDGFSNITVKSCNILNNTASDISFKPDTFESSTFDKCWWGTKNKDIILGHLDNGGTITNGMLADSEYADIGPNSLPAL